MNAFKVFACIVCVVCAGSAVAGQSPSISKISPRLQEGLTSSVDGDEYKVWVFFADKDESSAAYRKASATFTDRALTRRHDIPLDAYDLPVTAAYVDAITALGGRIIRTSRWLNGVSVKLTSAGILQTADLPFVRRIDPVLTLTRSPEPEEVSFDKQSFFDSAQYGASYTQIHMLGVDSLHRLTVPSADTTVPLDGAGVLMAFFDTGYLLTHPSFDSLRVVDTWDFINDDASVDDLTPTSSQRDHGTAVVSAAAGFAPGTLIGPAYGADVILAKTEIASQEIQIEEDNWVAAAEWADSLGADILSTSLGYNDWYTYADMDGNTALCTIAADRAASRGILVINCAGNEGSVAWHYIIAPADGDSVVAVGAVDAFGVITSFSSWGPTADGRIKPDVVAMGSAVISAYYQGGYSARSGTSLSTPLISGSAAVMLQANPALVGHPDRSIARLRMSADRYGHPDDQYGYGLPDMVLACGFGVKIMPVSSITIPIFRDTTITITALGPTSALIAYDPIVVPAISDFTDHGDGTATLSFSLTAVGGQICRIAAQAGTYVDTLEFTITGTGSGDDVSAGPNPFSDSVSVYFGGQAAGSRHIEVFTLSGELIYDRTGSANPLVWPGVNAAGERAAAGVYIIRVCADGIEKKVKVLKL